MSLLVRISTMDMSALQVAGTGDCQSHGQRTHTLLQSEEDLLAKGGNKTVGDT